MQRTGLDRRGRDEEEEEEEEEEANTAARLQMVRWLDDGKIPISSPPAPRWWYSSPWQRLPACRVVSCPCATWSPWRHRALAATSAIANAVLTDGQRTSIGGAVTRFPMARSSPHTDSFPPKPAVVSRFGVCRCCLAGSRFPVHAHLRIPML